MAMTKFTSSLSLDIQEKVTDGSGRAQDICPITNSTTYTLSGSGAGVITKQYNDQATIATAGTVTLDLSGSLTSRTGAAVVLTNVKEFYIKFVSGTGTLTIGGGSNPVPLFSGVLNPGEVLYYSAGSTGIGKTVTAGTGDILQIVSSADTAVYEIAIGGL